jgi:hypothetical protein
MNRVGVCMAGMFLLLLPGCVTRKSAEHRKAVERFRSLVKNHFKGDPKEIKPGTLTSWLLSASPDDFEYNFEGIRGVIARSQVE